MIDIKLIRQDPEAFRKAARDKRIACDIDAVIAIDDRRRTVQQELDQTKYQQNEISGQIAHYKNPKSKWYQSALAEGRTEAELKAEGQKLVDESSRLKERIKELEEQFRTADEELNRALLTIPQLPSPEAPIGPDETGNVEIKRVGEPPKFDFEAKDHVALMTQHGMLDVERGVKLSGARHYILKGDGALLHQAVLRLAMDLMIARGFVQMHVPVLVRDEVMVGTGYYPGGEEQAYRCERDGLSLVGTAEVPLTAYHSDEILGEDELPKKFVAVSPCFRREAGAAGKDTYGLYRIHIFEKVEQVILCRSDEEESKRFHHEILQNAEDVLAALELPYRVINVCTGDMGQGKVQQFDIETWMPSRSSYGETHSASRFGEYQARRLKLRYRDARKQIHYCHTLNNTVIASPRILIPLLECHQQADGSIKIPAALRPYVNGREYIGKS
jgi:seryl-tRNA synthetase